MSVSSSITGGCGSAAGGGGTGDVAGPSSATDNALARFDATTGKLLQDGVVTESDAGALSGATQLSVDNLRLDGNTVSSTDANGNINLTPNGTGDVVVADAADLSWSDILIARLAGPVLRVMDLAKTAHRTLQARAFEAHNGTTLKAALDPASSIGGLRLASDGAVGWESATSPYAGAVDAILTRPAAGVVSADTSAKGNGLAVLKFGGGRCLGLTSSAGAASTTEYSTDGDWGLHENTGTGAIHLARNKAGAIKSVALT